jgi:small subunit ribosomal protein S4
MKKIHTFKSCKKVFGNIWFLKKLSKKQKKVLSKARIPKKTNPFFLLKLIEKRKISIFYGNLKAKLLQKYIEQAKKNFGKFGPTFLNLVEKRLDVVLFKINFCNSIFRAKQLISHGKVLVNQKKISIPSHSLRPSDIIQIEKDYHPKLIQAIQNARVGFSKPQSLQTFDFLSPNNGEKVSFKENTQNHYQTRQKHFIQSMCSYNILLDQKTHDDSLNKKPFQKSFSMKMSEKSSLVLTKNLEKVKKSQKIMKKTKINLLKNKAQHVQVSYKILSAVYLFNPQILYFPMEFNVDKISQY